MMNENLLKIYESSFRDNWELPAISDFFGGKSLTYGDLARKIARYHILFSETGVKPGDKIGLMGKSSGSWITVYMATITYGAIIVPILQDFNPSDAQHIINHSEARMLFIDKAIYENFEFEGLHSVKAVISLDGSNLLEEHPTNSNLVKRKLAKLPDLFDKRYPNGFNSAYVKYPAIDPDTVAEINYTSGTTGFSKGVMLTFNNLCGNVVFGIRSQLHFRTSRCLAFLPLAHAYGCAFDMLTPLATGSHITVFEKLPTPKLLLKALAQVKPNLIVCVPLILEKIYRKQILPQISRPAIRRLLSIPILNRRIYNRIRNTLTEAFGGEFSQVIIGGAALNPEVESFLRKIGFRFTVGYGMTECGPLISYTYWDKFVPTSCGRTLPGIMQSCIKNVEGMTARTITIGNMELPMGEICVKGENVMKGYYKNPEATAQTIDEEGWLHTGDMGCIAPDGTIFIRGRYKTMILGPSGQNIYPEGIESKLNNMPYIAESLVVERGHKLVALVYPDFEAMDRDKLLSTDLPEIMEKIRADVNKMVAPFEQISHIQLMANEFEKTPKKSIKRYLYS
ncbi:MAG: long-chain fatty acid--CoA ligase [Bacteroides sp.]|nr:long-chain fatty acid--CoA ligase [Bacteroides sp.]